jgi:hypothetical protein
LAALLSISRARLVDPHRKQCKYFTQQHLYRIFIAQKSCQRPIVAANGSPGLDGRSVIVSGNGRLYFLNLAMWVVESWCNSLSQNLNAHIAGVHSAVAGRTPKNQRKEGHKFPARFATRAKTVANSWKTDKLFVRFLKLSGSERR